jgi:chorismate mutase
LAEISQTAADLRYDGLIIESHICPDKAWSDAKQQLEPEALEHLVRNVNWRKATADCPEFQKSLNLYRDEIDQIDSELFDLLSRRMDICEQIGAVKKENNVAILQSNRWGAIRDRILAQASKYNLSEEFLKTVLEAIHIESISRQNTVMNK